MSSGVSDQMKVPGNTAKSPEERNIPWSQQVDEASNENLSSPHADDNSAVNQNSMQFQNPPFNAKDLQNPAAANNYKTRKPYNNFDATKKHGKPSFYGNAKREDFPQNAWGSYNNTRRAISDNLPGNYNRTNKSDDGYISGNVDNKPLVEEKKVSAPQVAAPKKTTWASIASQPAKLTSRTTSITSSHKKKGPGMPPPPMVPGKHDLDVNTWDLPNNNPPPVPSPPPPIDQAFAEVTLNNAPGLPSDHVLGVRPEKSHKNADFHKQDDSAAHSGIYQGPNSFPGRLRSPPNGHSRKNWSTQHPLHRPQAMAPNPAMTTGPMRRGPDVGGSNNLNHVSSGGPGGGGGGPGSGNPSSNSSRYIVRGSVDRGDGDRSRSHNVNSRLDYDSSSSSYNYRDSENTSRYTPADKRNSVVDDIVAESPEAVLESLRDKNNYNPKEIDFEKASSARFFVIKSYSEDDIHRSIKYEIWCSTDHGNKRLDDAFKERSAEGGNILLFFSVNGSGHFCGMAQMMTAVDYSTTSSVWSQDKWRGKFKVKWIYVKDVPNGKFRHIRLENNENKSVTNSRDTQEVPNAKGKEVLQILHSYKHTTSIFDDFYHYEKKQEEEVSSKKPYDHPMGNSHQPPSHQQQMDRGGGLPQKHFSGTSSGGMGSFRERSSMQRGGTGGGGISYHNNYNSDRRFDNHRTTGSNNIGSNIPPSYSQKERSGERDAEGERSDGGDYGRHMGNKFDYNRRDERMKMKYNSRERDFSEDHGNGKAPESGRYRTISRETQKDNEYSNTVRVRGSNDY